MRFALIVIGLSGALACCSGTVPPSAARDAAADDLQPAFTALCKDYAQRVCEHAATCPWIQLSCVYNAPDLGALFTSCAPSLSGAADVWDDCRSTVAETCMQQYFGPGSPLVTVDLATACLGAFDFSTCSSGFSPIPPPSCPPGTLPDGTSCFGDIQCASGLCDRWGGSDPVRPYCGVCAKPVAKGDPCGTTICAAGLECMWVGSSVKLLTCSTAGAEGATCSSKTPDGCATGSFCVGGRCVAPTAHAGQPCDDGYCAITDASLCDPGNGNCVAFVPAKLGEACDAVWDGNWTATPGVAPRICEYPDFCDEPRCSTASCPTQGVCIAPLADGAPCTGFGVPSQPGSMCAAGRACVAGKCQRIFAADCVERAP